MTHKYTRETVAALPDDRLAALLANARRLGAGDVIALCEEEQAARRYGTELPREVAAKLEAALQAYEAIKAQEKGQRRFRAARTRNAIARSGLKTAVQNIVMRGASMGYATLPPELTFEHIICEHPDCFDAAVVDAAIVRLKARPRS
jgi:hypothetical protein